jgi:hypothetical protein
MIVALLSVTAYQMSGDKRTVNDTDIKTLLAESKRYVEPPFHVDSALMILRELLPKLQRNEHDNNRRWTLNIISCAYDVKGQ